VTRGDDETPAGIGGGIRNLCSNVSEWTARFEPPPGKAAGAGTYAVGASYQDSNYFFYKASFKSPAKRSPFVGFRCALSLQRVQEIMGSSSPALRIRRAGSGE